MDCGHDGGIDLGVRLRGGGDGFDGFTSAFGERFPLSRRFGYCCVLE